MGEDRSLIELLDGCGHDDDALRHLLVGDIDEQALFMRADGVRRDRYGDAVYIRGLIELSNYCRNDCYYCGIRRSNRKLQRYRLDEASVLCCCRQGYELGFRTFVLQGGEDPYYTDERLCSMIDVICDEFPDCALTLSMGERSRESYKRLYDAGARRYLLRHEAASAELYGRLHPVEMSLDERKLCLYDIRDTGFQTGAGLMIGVPFQSTEHLIEDIRFMQELQPDMIGIGPFMHHADTPMGKYPDGSMELTLRMLAICRILFPYALIPSTTALASISEDGRTLGLKAGANVIMPNLSPPECREKYSIYNNKKATGLESAQGLDALKREVAEAGYMIVIDRGDVRR